MIYKKNYLEFFIFIWTDVWSSIALSSEVLLVIPTTSNNASTVTASEKNKTNTKQFNANPKEPKKKGREPYERDENGNIIRPNKENQTSVQIKKKNSK